MNSKLRQAIAVCALRFDGYSYQDRTGKDLAQLRQQLEDLGIESLESDLDKFAAFFGFQRMMGKGGGTLLPADHPYYQLLEDLFWLFAPLEVPAEYANQEYVDEWNSLKTEFLHGKP